MRITQLIESLKDYQLYTPLNDFKVRGITCNSKEVEENFIFVAIKGNRADGNNFIPEAIDKGARVIIAQTPPLKAVSLKQTCFITVDDTRQALAVLAAEFYHHPGAKTKVVGITGTNGKTTITYLIEAVLKEAGFQPGVIGTINYRFKDKVIPSKNTTPGPVELQSMIGNMLEEGVDYVIMEVSSHALDQKRTQGINFSSAIFTNLTQDHLDYHISFEDYFQAKARLFQALSSASFAVINHDDAYGRRLKGLTPAEVITYGIDGQADVVARDIATDIKHTEFLLSSANLETHFKTQLIGRHNVYNILACAAWALKQGLDLKKTKSALEEFRVVPGRLERIDFSGDFFVFVDYAHTEDALKNVINSLRQVSRNKIIVVFGCGGERDKTKRPKMGYIVSQLADFSIITNDNPRSEDPQRIIEEIKQGIRKDNYCLIPDRRQAIEKSLSLAKAGDVVLIAGKGHEDYQIMGNSTVHFDDREAVRECLKSKNY